MLLESAEEALKAAEAKLDKAAEALASAELQEIEAVATHIAAKTEVARIKAAIAALNGETVKEVQPVEVATEDTPAPEEAPPKKRVAEGPYANKLCSGCGEVGLFVQTGPRILTCGGCRNQAIL